MGSRLPGLIQSASKALHPLEDGSFWSNFDDLGKYKVVLGDSSHGTSKFFHAHAEITKHLIEHHGFDTVAGDWPEAETVDRYVRQRPGVKVRIEYREEEPFQKVPDLDMGKQGGSRASPMDA